MSREILGKVKEKSLLRRKLLLKQLGVSNNDSLRSVISTKSEQVLALKNSNVLSSTDPSSLLMRGHDEMEVFDTSQKNKRWDTADMKWTEPVEETETLKQIYKDSSAFLKGTQSANPHNDYCQNFVDTGERPQNFIHDVGLSNRFEEYPKLRELIRLKDELIQKTNCPPYYIQADLQNFDLADLDCKFDSILIEPPLEEYQRTCGLSRDNYWSWDMIKALDIEKVAAPRSFIWIWCGSSDGLDEARNCLKMWGYRRCEDISWIKTNVTNPGHNKNVESKTMCQRTKEHCLMGIRGTVRRSTDGDFIHANIDIDLIIDEEKPWGSDEKPIEIFHLIEHFCLGRRRLHIFGRDTCIRPGWLSIGPDLSSSNYDSDTYNKLFHDDLTTGCSDDIERLRPKSPPPKISRGALTQHSNSGGRCNLMRSSIGRASMTCVSPIGTISTRMGMNHSRGVVLRSGIAGSIRGPRTAGRGGVGRGGIRSQQGLPRPGLRGIRHGFVRPPRFVRGSPRPGLSRSAWRHGARQHLSAPR